MKRVLVLNGPNLDLLGSRQPEVYGSLSLAELAGLLWTWGSQLGIGVEHFQSNHEGELVERIHGAGSGFDGIMINPGALTHYSYAIEDALGAVSVPAVEVHISNIREREGWRRRSVLQSGVVARIFGRGVSGYRFGLLHLFHRAMMPFETLAYGSFPDQVADFRRPPGGSQFPLAVLIHGGLWRQPWTRDTTEGWALGLVERGWATLNLEYRRLGSGGGWPQSFADVTAALAWAATLPEIDRDRIVVAGHSAGATMALWAAGEKVVPAPARVVSVAGITDLVRAEREGLGDNSVAALYGRRPSASEAISPLHRLPIRVPVGLLSCLEDSLVSPGYARDFAAAAAEAGDQAQLVEIRAPHMAVVDPVETAQNAAIDLIAGD